MSNYEFSPFPAQTLTTDEQIRAYVNPTRMTILALLAQDKCSVSGVARQLGVHPANLTHHFKLLEKVGLIQLVEKRDTGKNLEKLYRAAAYHFTIETDDQTTSESVLVLSILRDNLTAATQFLKHQTEEQTVLGVLKTVRLHPEDVEKFARKLLYLAQEFEEHAAEVGEAYSLNVSLYPTESADGPAQKIVIGMGE